MCGILSTSMVYYLEEVRRRCFPASALTSLTSLKMWPDDKRVLFKALLHKS